MTCIFAVFPSFHHHLNKTTSPTIPTKSWLGTEIQIFSNPPSFFSFLQEVELKIQELRKKENEVKALEAKAGSEDGKNEFFHGSFMEPNERFLRGKGFSMNHRIPSNVSGVRNMNLQKNRRNGCVTFLLPSWFWSNFRCERSCFLFEFFFGYFFWGGGVRGEGGRLRWCLFSGWVGILG